MIGSFVKCGIALPISASGDTEINIDGLLTIALASLPMSRKLPFITIRMLKCLIDCRNFGSKWHNLGVK